MNRPPRVIVVLALLPLGGCVTRQIQVTSQPPGALVYLNDHEAGRTPFTTDFTWYGDYEVVVRKDGYDTIVSKKKIAAPWWQFLPFDFFAEISPFRPTDAHKLNFTMREAVTDEPPQAIVTRGLALALKLPASRPTTRPATTKPTTKPAASRPAGAAPPRKRNASPAEPAQLRES